jgi:chemotaxis protein histidine kinase CheA
MKVVGSLTNQLGGTFTVKRSDDGAGSVFAVELPGAA